MQTQWLKFPMDDSEKITEAIMDFQTCQDRRASAACVYRYHRGLENPTVGRFSSYNLLMDNNNLPWVAPARRLTFLQRRPSSSEYVQRFS